MIPNDVGTLHLTFAEAVMRAERMETDEGAAGGSKPSSPKKPSSPIGKSKLPRGRQVAQMVGGARRGGKPMSRAQAAAAKAKAGRGGRGRK